MKAVDFSIAEAGVWRAELGWRLSRGDRHGMYRSDSFYHASLSPDEYTQQLATAGFGLLDHELQDWQTGGARPVWLANAGSAQKA